VRARLRHADGREEEIRLRHTLSEEQIAWFRAGSALNLLRRKRKG
jgi:aconitate hydratase